MRSPLIHSVIGSLAISVLFAAPTTALAQWDIAEVRRPLTWTGDTQAYDVNQYGLVCGNGDYVSGSSCVPFVYDGVSSIELPYLAPEASYPFGYAHAINSHGVVAGWSHDADDHDRAVFWSGGIITQIPVPADIKPTGDMRAYGLNDAGVIAGYYVADDGYANAYYYDGATHSLEPALHDAGLTGLRSYARDVNNSGLLCGHAEDAADEYNFFTYDISTGTLTVLGLMYPSESCHSAAMNESGLVVGRGRTDPFSPIHAVVHNGGFVVIDDTVTDAQWATDIANDGRIVGSTNTGDNRWAWYCDTPGSGNMLAVDMPGWMGPSVQAVNDHHAMVGHGETPTSGGDDRAFIVAPQVLDSTTTWSMADSLYPFAATDTDSDYYAHWAHDAAGNWVCVWSAAIPGSSDRDFDILVSRSSDNGVTWTDPAILDPLADSPPEIEDDFHANVYTDGAGNWIAVWYTHDDRGGTIGDDTDLLVSRSADNGVTWTPSIPLNSDAATDAVGDSTPDLAHAGGGTWIAVWTRKSDPDTGDYDVYTSRSLDYGATWSPLTLLHTSMSSDTGDDGSARLDTDGIGNFIAVWSSEDPLDGSIEVDNDIFFATSTDGIAWSTPAVLNSDAAVLGSLDDKMPRILFDGTGRWLTVWYYGDFDIDYDIKFSYSDDNGASWSPLGVLNTNSLTDSGRDLYPVPATDGDGNWVVVWQSKEPLPPTIGADYDIFYATSSDNGVTWNPPKWLNSNAPDIMDSLYDRDPEVLYAGDGMWRVVWGSNYDFGGTLGGDYDLMISSARFPVTPGDIDLSGRVDLADFATFATCYRGVGVTVPPPSCTAEQFDASDLDDDLDVDLADFATFAANYGS